MQWEDQAWHRPSPAGRFIQCEWVPRWLLPFLGRDLFPAARDAFDRFLPSLT
jgi:hypothetical protein